ncbi:YagK/YfjJ domain-containing protein [Paucidesulfovibrio longus]|uniref:YagK/YfjJ domain-containing protein n=1 Tax=Paucidesulfovibrio longus TaxID=889 RepID=UPI0003FAA5A4|nr:inovirus-type Gp2 protein [Paucidesulfovibrio longus]
MKTTREPRYNGYQILTDSKKGYACNTKILDTTLKIIQHTTEKHNKVLCTRFDLRFPQQHPGQTTNESFSKFTSAMMKELSRKGLDPKYIAVREQSREKHQHYHMAVFADGNKIQFPHAIIQSAEKHWGNAVNSDQPGLVDHCTQSRSGQKQYNSYRLRRNDPDFEKVKNDCVQRLSYLAKVNTKGKTPKYVREVFSSRIPKG